YTCLSYFLSTSSAPHPDLPSFPTRRSSDLVFAVSTYATVSLLFWYIGLIPDLATLRDRSQSRMGRAVYGIFAMGWRGSAQHWHRDRKSTRLNSSHSQISYAVFCLKKKNT